MSRPNGSKNNEKLPPELSMSVANRLEYIAKLLLEIIEEEISKSEANNAATRQ